MYSDSPYRDHTLNAYLYDGKQVNRTNQQNIPIGYWIEFYPSGSMRSEKLYPENPAEVYEDVLWTKDYWQDGNLQYYERNDTSESWYDNGQLKEFQVYGYDGDSLYHEEYKFYKNGQRESQVISSRIHGSHEGNNTILNSRDDAEVYTLNNAWFEDGSMQRLRIGDTTKSWYENGQLRSWTTRDTSASFYDSGNIESQTKNWTRYHPVFGGDLGFSLMIWYYPNGQRKYFRYCRDEYCGENRNQRTRIEYFDWEWSESGRLTEHPSRAPYWPVR